MTYWTILWITVIGGPLNGSQSYLVYPSYEECMAAHQIVSETISYDHKIKCEESLTPSKSIRPLANPRYEDAE